MKYAYIEELLNEFPVVAICRALDIGRSGFYAWRKRPPSPRSREDLALRHEIKRLHYEHLWTLGAIKTWKLLNARGIHCGKHRIRRLRKLDGIEACRAKRIRKKQAYVHTEQPVPDQVKRQFTVASPNKVWVGDITSLRTKEGWLHLAVVLDLYARYVVGWATDPTIAATLPMTALRIALNTRKPTSAVIFHSDQGSVYSSASYRALMAGNGVVPSMSRKGNCHDNAVAESFFSTLKNEAIHDRIFESRQEAEAVINNYIGVYYNQTRLHQTLGYRTPANVEAQFSVPN